MLRDYPNITESELCHRLHGWTNDQIHDILVSNPDRFKSSKSPIPHWSSTNMERTSLDEIYKLAKDFQATPDVDYQRIDQLGGDRYIGVAKFTLGDIVVVSKPSIPRRLPADAKVYAAHGLLNQLRLDKRLPGKLRSEAGEMYNLAWARGRPLVVGEQWPDKEGPFLEFKGNQNAEDGNKKKFHKFNQGTNATQSSASSNQSPSYSASAQPSNQDNVKHANDQWSLYNFNSSRHKWAAYNLVAFLNTRMVDQADIPSEASIVFGVDDKTRIIHGIYIALPVGDKIYSDPKEDIKRFEVNYSEALLKQIRCGLEPVIHRDAVCKAISVLFRDVTKDPFDRRFLAIFTIRLEDVPVTPYSYESKYVWRKEAQTVTITPSELASCFSKFPPH